MRNIVHRLAIVGAALGVACAGRPAPPTQHYVLGMARADYRDYGAVKASPCDSEPRWLADELTAVNGLLSRFLQGTEHATTADSVEHAQHLALLEEAERTLPPVLKVHESNLALLNRCGFRESGAFPEISRRGAELLKAVRARLEEGPSLAEIAARKEAYRKWREAAPEREATAKSTWCPPKPRVGQTDVYFARASEDGRTEWLFCDGHVVEQAAGGEPSLRTPEGLTKQELRRVQPKEYLEAVQRYPASEIDKPPALTSGGPT